MIYLLAFDYTRNCEEHGGMSRQTKQLGAASGFTERKRGVCAGLYDFLHLDAAGLSRSKSNAVFGETMPVKRGVGRA